MALGVEDILVERDDTWVSEDHVEVLHNLGEEETKEHVRTVHTIGYWQWAQGPSQKFHLPGNVILKRATEGLGDITQLTHSLRRVPASVCQNGLESLPGIVLPAGVAGGTPSIPHALDRLGIRAAAGASNKEACARCVGGVGRGVFGRAVCLVGGVVPGPFWICMSVI